MFLIMREGAKADDRALIAFAERRMGRSLEVLAIRRVPSLPMTPTGKISKADLKKQIL